MLLAAAVVGALVGPGPRALADDPPAAATAVAAVPDRLAPLRFLAGACWQGRFPDSEQTDTHCYRALFGTAFLRDVHRVSPDAQGNDYRGETIYAWRPETQRIGYRYFNSLGGVSDGEVFVGGDGRLEFPGEHYTGPDGERIELRSVLTRLDDARYVTVTEQFVDDRWQAIRRVEFVRQADAADTGPAARQQADRLAALARLVGDWADPEAVAKARASGDAAPVQFAYRWGPRRMLLRTYEGLGPAGAEGVADPVLEGIVYWDHVAGAFAFAASTRYGWTFQGQYRLLDDGSIERRYDVHYARDEQHIPEPDLGGQVRRFRETFTFDGDDRLSIRLDIFRDDAWRPFGPGVYVAQRIGD